MKLTEVIKQKSGSKNCVGCAVAMATGTTLNDFEKVRGEKKSYTIIDAVAYLFHCGFTPEFRIQEHASSDNFLDDLKEFNLTWMRALVFVKSETQKGIEHAVYYDGRWCYDPNPGVKEKRKLKSYDIVGFLPFTQFTERPEWWDGVNFCQ